jgi:Trypsin
MRTTSGCRHLAAGTQDQRRPGGGVAAPQQRRLHGDQHVAVCSSQEDRRAGIAVRRVAVVQQQAATPGDAEHMAGLDQDRQMRPVAAVADPRQCRTFADPRPLVGTGERHRPQAGPGQRPLQGEDGPIGKRVGRHSVRIQPQARRQGHRNGHGMARITATPPSPGLAPADVDTQGGRGPPGVPKRGPGRLAAALILLLAGVAEAASPGIIGPDDRRPLAQPDPALDAVGRVNHDGGFCTGALIAPDRVLTAAHCLWDPRQRQLVRPGKLHFLAG